MTPKPLDQISEADFRAYEKVRARGRWNMFDPMAKRATGLDNETYIGVMRYYTELAKKYLPKERA